MSLTNYGQLKTAVADWAFTGGGVTSTLVGADFFPQVQSMVYYGHGTDIEPLRLRSMMNSDTITTDANGQITISTGVSSSWLEFVEITPVLAGSLSLNYVQPWQFRKQADLLQDTTPPPTIYTIEGDTLSVAPKVASTDLTAQWYEKFTALSADGDTDWVLTNAPQVYLDGCLMLACAYTDDPRESQFRAKFAAGIKGLNMNDQRQRASGSVPVARPRSVV